MHTNATTRRPTLVRAAAAFGFCLLVAGGSLAPGQAPGKREPAARLKIPQPIESSNSPIITRGLEPDARPLTPTLPVSPMTPSGWSNAPAATAPRTTPARTPLLPRPKTPTRPPVVTSVTEAKPSLVDRAWTGVKDLFNGPTVTAAPMPLPALGAVPHQPYSFVAPTAPRPTPAPANVYAGPPAYRWYGWGTTTPGANPYAPGGEHPRGSANWFSQTGATPGAFPVPVSGASLAYGASPPSYAMPIDTTTRWPIDRSMIPLTVPVVSVQPPVIQTYPGVPTMTPMPVTQTGTALPMLTMPAGAPVPLSVAPASGAAPDSPAWQRSDPATPTGVPMPMPSLPAPPPASDTNWGPAKDAAPVFRGQGPSSPEPVTLEGLIRSASSHWATITEIKPIGQTKLVVKLAARTEVEARAAADAISRLPQLKPYAVLFEVKLGAR